MKQQQPKKRRSSLEKLDSSYTQIQKLIKKIETADQNGLIELFPNAKRRMEQLYCERKQEVQKQFITVLEKSIGLNNNTCLDNNSLPFGQGMKGQEMKEDLSQSTLIQQYTQFRKQIQIVLRYLQTAEKFQNENDLKNIKNKSKKKMKELGQQFSNLDKIAISTIEKVWEKRNQLDQSTFSNTFMLMTQIPSEEEQVTMNFVRKCSDFPNYRDYAQTLHQAYQKCNKIIEYLQPQENSLLDQIKCKLYSIIDEEFPTILKSKIKKLNQNSEYILIKVKNFKSILLD